MKLCRYCGLPVVDGGAAHEACVARAAKLELLDHLEQRITSAPMPGSFGKSPKAAYLMARAMAINPITDCRSWLGGCKLARPARHGA